MADFTLLEASWAGYKFGIAVDRRVEHIFSNKGAEYKYLGNTNLNEIFGENISYYRVFMYIMPSNLDDVDNDNEYQWLKIKEALLRPELQHLQLPDYPAMLAIPVPGQDMTLCKYRGYYTIEIIFSTAPVQLTTSQQITQNLDSQANNVKAKQISFLQRALNFQGNVQSKVAKFSSNVIALGANIDYYASNIYAISNITSTVTTALDSLVGNLSFLSSSISSVKDSLVNIPNNIENFTTNLQNMMTQFVNVFNSPNLAIDGMLQVGSFGNDIAQPSNESKTAQDNYKNAIALACVIKTEALINIYLQAQSISFITTQQIETLIKQENSLYQFLINNNATNDALLTMRNAFYQIILTLLQSAIKIQTVEIKSPISLRTLVFKYNQNLDYLEETRIYNKITNTSAVQGTISILLN